MTDPCPFFTLSKIHAQPIPDGSSTPPSSVGADEPERYSNAEENVPAQHHLVVSETLQELYDASLSGVQSSFSHLSKIDIAHPPHHWFDAALARQIALYIMHKEFEIPRRRIALELERSREAILRAMNTVDERMLNEQFAENYEAMKQVAHETLKGDGG